MEQRKHPYWSEGLHVVELTMGRSLASNTSVFASKLSLDAASAVIGPSFRKIKISPLPWYIPYNANQSWDILVSLKTLAHKCPNPESCIANIPRHSKKLPGALVGDACGDLLGVTAWGSVGLMHQQFHGAQLVLMVWCPNTKVCHRNTFSKWQRQGMY